MTVCPRCCEPTVFCTCWSFEEIAFAAFLFVASIATFARLWFVPPKGW